LEKLQRAHDRTMEQRRGLYLGPYKRRQGIVAKKKKETIKSWLQFLIQKTK